MAAIEPLSTQMPYMVGIGNHEYDFLAQGFRPWWSDYMGARANSFSPFFSAFHGLCVCFFKFNWRH